MIKIHRSRFRYQQANIVKDKLIVKNWKTDRKLAFPMENGAPSSPPCF